MIELLNEKWPHVVMKVDTDDYFDQFQVVRKLESDGVGFKRSGKRTKWFGSLKDFDLVKGKLQQKVRSWIAHNNVFDGITDRILIWHAHFTKKFSPTPLQL